ncbi:metalloprotease [Diaporthe helianthi]|uniref:Metalloprotease n=1 Tax=Diaporthe helianthi TaxID=158607 RepID=A0A2P5HP30_DIAHE|nr:metalloprotease [Diaporthe helianthi]
MLFKTIFLTAIAASHAVAQRICGTPDPTEEEIALAKSFYQVEKAARLAGNAVSAAATIEVNVYFHVLATSTSASGGYLTTSQISAQLDAMNTAFAPHGVSFVNAGTDWTVNSNYANDGSETTMKRALRKGTYADLNLYFVYSMEPLGYCYYPTTTSGSDSSFYLDGCTILASTVPGGEAPFDLGLTAVHEVGHWFGLYHTFEGGCAVGDRVDDTPAEASFASGCPVGRDTCTAAGVDPIHNYMDYTDDACYEEFTPGQEDRIYSYWNEYRASFK